MALLKTDPRPGSWGTPVGHPRQPLSLSLFQLLGVFAIQPNHTQALGNCSSQLATLDLRFPEGRLLFTFLKVHAGLGGAVLCGGPP